MKIAFIGLGVMGRPMADNLVSAGFDVWGFDINPARLAGFKGHIATSQADAAKGADALFIMVVSSAQADDVLFSQGALKVLAPKAMIILCPTCSPASVEALALKLEESQHSLIDCPVSGGYLGAQAGTLTLMVGCSDENYKKILPLLKPLGTKIFHVGQKPSQGALVKMLNNLIAGVQLTAVAEAMSIAQKNQLNTDMLLELFAGSAAGSWILQDRGARMVQKSPEVKTRLDILKKDLTLIVETGQHLKVDVPLAQVALEKFNKASQLGFGNDDDSQIIQAYRSKT